MKQNKPEASNSIAEEFKYYVSIHFKGVKKVYFFGLNENNIEYGDYVVVETARGVELGEVVSNVREREGLTISTPLKPILRKAIRKDIQQYEENKEQAKKAMVICQEAIQKLHLDMNLISCEYTLDRNKVIFVYVADDRVDFRELLKELAAILKCRIELRQIGPRDKAKLVGGLGTCGMETCCSRFLEDFDVVSINMAKNQLLALNIQKLSGQCGKLMCCLKYEDTLYKEKRKGLPKLNAQIPYNGKMYRVTSMNVLTRQAKLENREEALFLPFEEAFKEYVPKEVKVTENEETAKLQQ